MLARDSYLIGRVMLESDDIEEESIPFFIFFIGFFIILCVESIFFGCVVCAKLPALSTNAAATNTIIFFIG